MSFIIIVDCSKDNAHEDVLVEDCEGHEEEGKPTTSVICRHPVI